MNIQGFVAMITETHVNQDGYDFMDVFDLYSKQLSECDEDVLLEGIKNIKDVGLKYLLQAIVEETHGALYCIDTYELSSKNDCAIALFRLARLYDTGGLFTVDVNRAMYYYYMYYNKINDLASFCKYSKLMKDPNLCQTFMDEYINIIDENKELYEQNKKLKEINKQLDERIAELESMPKGVRH